LACQWLLLEEVLGKAKAMEVVMRVMMMRRRTITIMIVRTPPYDHDEGMT